MEGNAAETKEALPLNKLTVERRTTINRIHAIIYTFAALLLFYHRFLTLLHSNTFLSFSIFLSFLASELVLFFAWIIIQAHRWRPVRREVYPGNLAKVVKEKDLPGLDVFICTADPYKEPPMNVANTALSIMAFDYPTDKISVYVSDDGGSAITLLAFMEAAMFAKHWIPYCRDNQIEDRCPEVYFRSANGACARKTKMIYEGMKERVERALERGHVSQDEITSEEERNAFQKWTEGFTRQNHPTVIQVLLESDKDGDVTGHALPNLIYVSREKRKACPHHFKAGALNSLLRVSAEMTCAPVILTLDCDMYSNDLISARRALCHIMDPAKAPKLAFVQFPQIFQGINKNDIYGCEYKRLVRLNQIGTDGLKGPAYIGTGCYFQRKAFSGPPTSPILELHNPNGRAKGGLKSEPVLRAAHQVASCTHENDKDWGWKVGFRYGSVVEDYYTGYRLHCEGWESVYCNPDKPAFLGDAPISLSDALAQNMRWSVGLLEVWFSKYNPVIFGTTRISFLMGLCYSHNAFWTAGAVPITTYAFLPQLALLNQVKLFPSVSDPWFYLYAYLFICGCGQELIEFLITGSSIQKWWSDQRMWMIRGLSSYPFAFIQFLSQSLGIPAVGFNVTSKVIDDAQSKRYEQGKFEFGVHSPLFVPPATAAIINLISFTVGLGRVLLHGKLGEMFVQLFISGFAVANAWPIYEAMLLRRDNGRMPMKTTVMAMFLSWVIYFVASIMFRV